MEKQTEVSSAALDRVYSDAFAVFGAAIADPEHLPIWLHFTQGDFNASNFNNTGSERYRRFSGTGSLRIDFPVSSGILEPHIRPIVRAFLRDGFRLQKGV